MVVRLVTAGIRLPQISVEPRLRGGLLDRRFGFLIPSTPTPALRFPLGLLQADAVFAEGIFSGRAPLTALRIPLSRFSGVNLADVAEVALVFDQTDSGALFLADLEWVRPLSLDRLERLHRHSRHVVR